MSDTCHEHISGKSRTWTMKRGSFGVSTIATRRDGLEKSREKSATSPFASF